MCGCKDDPCGKLPECTCPVKDLSTDCVLYTGDDLACSDIKKGTILTNAIKQIDAFICAKFDDVLKYLSLANIGTGAKVYKGINGVGTKEIRSVVSEDTNLLDVIENADTIGIKAGVHGLELNGQSLELKIVTDSGETVLATVTLPTGTTDTYVVSGVYSVQTENIVLTLNDNSTVTIDMSSIPTGEDNVQVDVLESNTSAPEYIKNKNPSRTVTIVDGGTYTVVITDNNTVLEIDNGGGDVTISMIGTLPAADFFVGFIQKGVGVVTFTNYNNLPAGMLPESLGQGHVCALDIIGGTKYLLGNLKPI